MADDPLTWALAGVRAARRRGGLFEAYDLATTAMDEHGFDPELAYEAVLCLARAGASELAHRRYVEFGLNPDLGLDYATLIARIEKDEALAASGEERHRRLQDAAEAYRAAYTRIPDYYPAINAATLYLLSADEQNAKQFAELARSHLSEQAKRSAEPPGFWELATAAEAALILDDVASAVVAIERATAIPDLDVTDVATTRRQLRLVVAARGLDPAILDPMAPPAVAHFTGHRIAAPGRAGRFPPALEEAVAEGVRAAIDRHRVRVGYGSLASGADILFAEAILDAGGEVHVVLPFGLEDFVRISVAKAGEAWSRRFEALIGRPRVKVTLATSDPFLGDDEIFAYATSYAMGLAVMRAQILDGPAIQLAVWDGAASAHPAGTAADVALWRDGLKRPCEVIWPTDGAARAKMVPPNSEGAAGEPAPSARSDRTSGQTPSRRVLRALLFCDVEGFSRLNDAAIPAFYDGVMGSLAGVLRRHGEAILFKNTWGDAIHVIVSDAPSAAALALDLQAEMGRIDLGALGLPEGLALRVGAHVGPIYTGWDHVVEKETFIGAQLTRCARIEPIAFAGKVFVSEAFAADLALTSRAFICEYVGTIPTAKHFGAMPMYLLRRRR